MALHNANDPLPFMKIWLHNEDQALLALSVTTKHLIRVELH
jgi:hypothetical protein